MNLLIEIVVERERRAAKRRYDASFRYNEEHVYSASYFQKVPFLHAGNIVRMEMMHMLVETGDIGPAYGFPLPSCKSCWTLPIS